MKNSYFHIMKFKHGFLKVKKIPEKRDERLMMLRKRNYVKGVHKNNSVVNVKKMYTFCFFFRKV